ncbi:uncharacterized protein EI90DRAFT_3153536 [Cantharellus anzutake]|uniref:uncharacterized protein n=1 Tax=Cantharellus anzutake TaxID=1750568 RepID=UPI001903DC52|nr:uncharacterized protein EI90DRAFT_3153536 [Cantharellus anzutake]KAF8334212.1 hypothetical protein EI90DRAFT_3153536 [Cantharellus anzutake]
MKYNPGVSSSRRKARKAYFTAPSSVRHSLMSAPLSKALRKEHNVRSLPIAKGDVVKILVGKHKGREGKVTTVYRKKWVIFIEHVTREKSNGSTVQLGIRPSNVVITTPKIDKGRKRMLQRRAFARSRPRSGQDDSVNDVVMQDAEATQA